MAKIAVELERALAHRAMNGSRGQAAARMIARGDGWTVEDVVCTSSPQDRPFEEQHSNVRIAIVTAGSFQYAARPQYAARSAGGGELMTPGSFLLGNTGQCFECRHEHGTGDRCLSFGYAPGYFENLAADAGIRGTGPDFQVPRLPPLRAMSPLVARAIAGLTGGGMNRSVPWEELSLQLAGQTVQLAAGLFSDSTSAPAGAVARVTRVVRMIEQHPGNGLTLRTMAREARLSPYHFLRTFQLLTGVTPHQYILRRRLREAAMRLTAEKAKVLDIALDCGFGDVSNFNHAFRTEFGISPRAYRLKTTRN